MTRVIHLKGKRSDARRNLSGWCLSSAGRLSLGLPRERDGAQETAKYRDGGGSEDTSEGTNVNGDGQGTKPDQRDGPKDASL